MSSDYPLAPWSGHARKSTRAQPAAVTVDASVEPVPTDSAVAPAESAPADRAPLVTKPGICRSARPSTEPAPTEPTPAESAPAESATADRAPTDRAPLVTKPGIFRSASPSTEPIPADRVILHADMDAFYAAVEQRDHPELRGRPVIVGGGQRRGVVATCSYEARRFGVHSAMPGTEARRRCPHGIFVAPRMEVYSAVARQIHSIFAHFTPLVEPLSLDEAFLDVTGSQRLFGSGPQIARQLKEAVLRDTGLTVSVGVAPCKFVAKVASDLEKPDGLVDVGADQIQAFLAPLSVSRLWGAGPVTQQRLLSAGVRTLGDVQQLPLEDLAKILGDRAAHFQRLCNGDDPRPVVPERGVKSVSHETTFGEDLHNRDQCHQILFELSEKVGRRLRRQGLRGRTIHLKLRLGDFSTYTRQVSLHPGEATADDRVIYQHARTLFQALWSGAGIRLLGVGVSDWATAADVRQGNLFETPGVDRDAQILEVMDRLRDRFGSAVVRHAGAASSHRPRTK